MASLAVPAAHHGARKWDTGRDMPGAEKYFRVVSIFYGDNARM